MILIRRRRLKRWRLRLCRVQVPVARNALEGVDTAVCEAQVGARDEILHGTRNQHLIRLRGSADSGPEVNGDAADLVSHHLTLSRVESGAERDPERGDRLASGASAADRARRTVEGGEKPVTGGATMG